MNNSLLPKLLLAGFLLFTAFIFTPNTSYSQNDSTIIGMKIRIGGRYDNIRMCVATPPGTTGGTAADISFFTEFQLKQNKSLHIDIPLFRPILFASAFSMLQFEPSMTYRISKPTSKNNNFILGPTIGVSLHYGPDYKSEQSGDERTEDFFAMGPILGGYFGIEFKSTKAYRFELGVSPYFTPLFSINDPENHQGVVIGGLLDASFRF